MKNNYSLLFYILLKLKLVSQGSRLNTSSSWYICLYLPKILCKFILFKYCYSSFFLDPLNFRFIRAYLWKKIGVNLGRNVAIGHTVSLDVGNANLIHIGNNVTITNNCILLCHQKDLAYYQVGDNIQEQPYVYKPIHISNGVHIGMGSIIMPGVTIGEGCIIGAHAVVTKNIPAWSVAVGSPARVLRTIQSKKDE